MPKRRRRFVGIIPRVVGGVGTAARWTLGHPQTLIAAAFVAITLWALWSYTQRSEAFRIAHVSLPAHSSLRLRAPLIGQNLWGLDIHVLADELKRQQPWLKEVRVIRQLPNTIRIDPIPRVPVAQLRIGPWYPVDREGFILPEAAAEPAERLIRLVGFERAGSALRAGRENTDERLKLALRILGVLQRSPTVAARRLTEINVADPQQIRFLITLSSVPSGGAFGGETEVRCGSEAEFEAHLKQLQAALKVIAKQQLAVDYIDVRFHEPVVGPRT